MFFKKFSMYGTRVDGLVYNFFLTEKVEGENYYR